jgi:hypothetical protein
MELQAQMQRMIKKEAALDFQRGVCKDQIV